MLCISQELHGVVAKGTVECGALTVNMRIRKTDEYFGKRSNVLKVAVVQAWK